MDKSDRTSPYRTPPWYCCFFENLVAIFSLLPSHTILPTNLPDRRGVPRWPEVPQVRTKHSAHGRELQEPLPGGQHTGPSSTSTASLPGSGKAAMWRHLCCTATGTSKDSDLPGSLWLGGWKLQFRCCPWSWVGAGAGIALAGGTGRAAGQGSHSYCRGGKTQQGRGPGPKEIACQGLRRAAATHSPLAFSGTATARRRKPPS